MVTSVIYEQWTSTDRCTLEKKEEHTDIFLKNLPSELADVLKHDFLANAQAKYLTDLKNKLCGKEYVVCLDFSENYSCRVQNSIQSEYWNTTQATIHPYVIYYKENSNVRHKSFVIISDVLDHDSTAVNLFNSKLILFMIKLFGRNNVNKIFYFSDGAGSQYKKKYNFINMLNHKKDFGVDAEWYFFATAHGKGACDGVGGVVKRCAYCSSLQNSNGTKITGPKALFNWAKSYFKLIDFEYCTKIEHESHAAKLKERYSVAKTLKNTRQFHCFFPRNGNEIECKIFSAYQKSVILSMK